MTARKAKQRAELRVVLHEAGHYALLLRASVVGQDVYCGWSDRAGEFLRSSHHQSGATHTYIFGSQRAFPEKAAALAELTGTLRLWGGAQDLDDLDWDIPAQSPDPARGGPSSSMFRIFPEPGHAMSGRSRREETI